MNEDEPERTTHKLYQQQYQKKQALAHLQYGEQALLLGENTEGGWFHPTGRPYAYVVLFFVSVISLAGYFIYDTIGVEQQPIQDDLDINAAQFGLLYSIYSFPNCILPFVGGFFQDRFGINLVLFGCCCFIAVGALLVAAGPLLAAGTTAYIVMLLGRLLFGIGAETTYVAQNTILVNWFKGREMALAMAVSVSAGRLGTWLTLNAIPPAVVAWRTWKVAVYLGAAFGIFELLSAIIYIFLDRYAQKQKRKTSETFYVSSEIVSSRDYTPSSSSSTAPPSLRDVISFPVMFWLFLVATTLFYMAIFPFQSTAITLLEKQYHYDSVNAGRIVSLLPLITMIFTPFCGIFVDKVGKRLHMVVLSLLIMIAANLVMMYTKINPIISIIAISVSFSVFPAAIWPCLPLFVEEQLLATAFGLVSSINNLGMVVSFYVQGWVVDATHNNATYQLLFYTLLLGAATLLCVVWWVLDYRTGNVCAKKA